MEVSEFPEIRSEFQRRVERIVWCNVATMDRRDRPRSRILHPVWEYPEDQPVGWIATGRHTLKTKHLDRNPFVSLTYWDPEHEQVMAECRASWEDDPDEKARIWNLICSAPEPVGYDLNMFWPGGLDDPNFGAMKLQPWRLELWSLAALARREEPKVWRQEV